MIFAIMHFLGGYCQIVLSGSHQERFLNICVSKDILLWHVERKDNHYIFYVSRGASRELGEIAAKTGCSYRCLRQRGLPYAFSRYRKRKCLLLSLLLCLGALYGLSLYIWQIDTTGCYSHSREEILDYLKEQGVRSGMRIRSLSCSALEEQIRKDYPDIAWVSCDRKGTLLTVAVKETLDVAGNKTEETTPCNLIAAKEGTIDAIVVRSGTAMVKKGDTVKVGDVLIAGTVELYDDAGEVTETTTVPASGDIYALTKVRYEDSFPLLHYEKQYTGRSQQQYRLSVGGRWLDIPGKKMAYEHYDVESRQKNLHIGPQFYLPVSLLVRTVSECEIEQKTYSRKQALAQAEQRLSLFLAEYEAKGVEILKNNVKIDCDKNQCVAAGTVLLRERFGKVQKIDDAAQRGAKE